MKTLHIISLILLSTFLLQCKPKSNDHFKRSIALHGQSNFRDIGNYTNEDGEMMKSGLVYRSGALSKLDSTDIIQLEELNIKTVVSFLTPGEIAKYGMDKLPSGVNYYNYPITGNNNEAQTVLKARMDGDFSKVPISFNYDIHQLLIEVGQSAYLNLFKLLADEDNYPIVFHCSHGVHRTGTAAALVHATVGIPWETITEDYLLSNQCRKEEVSKRINELSKLAKNNPYVFNMKENKENITAFYKLKKEYLEGCATAIQQDYGNTNNYLQHIGLTENEISNIKSILLQ